MRFSVIIPVYNKAKTIVNALDSIYAQTIQDFEIVVVNDGSTDNIQEILSNYNRPVKLISQENRGVSEARNHGIRESEGEYICFLDADDIWFPNHLEVITKMMNKYPEECFFATCHKCSYPNGSIIDCNKSISYKEEQMLVDDLIGFVNKYGGVVNTNSICVSRSLLFDENIFFEVGEKLGEDVDVWYRIALTHSVVISKEMTTLYRREFSTATKQTSNPNDWCFVHRWKDIIGNPIISRKIQNSYIQMCDNYYLAKAREYSYEANKEKATGYLNRVRVKNGKYAITKIIVLLPNVIVNCLPLRFKI